METKIRKWGNSLGLRIPKAFAEELGVGVGATVDVTIREGDLVVRMHRPPRLRLDDLISAVTPENLHREVDTGGPLGREVW